MWLFILIYSSELLWGEMSGLYFWDLFNVTFSKCDLQALMWGQLEPEAQVDPDWALGFQAT